MTKSLILIITIGTCGLLALALFISFSTYQNANANGFLGLTATQITATTTTVGPGGPAKVIFEGRAACTARTISTADGTGMGIKFLTADPGNGDLASTTLAMATGLWQAGSTTVTYEAGENGCGKWTAKAAASTTITVVEYQ